MQSWKPYPSPCKVLCFVSCLIYQAASVQCITIEASKKTRDTFQDVASTQSGVQTLCSTHLTSTHASRKPNTELTAAAARAQENETKYAWVATGSKALDMNILGGVSDALDCGQGRNGDAIKAAACE